MRRRWRPLALSAAVAAIPLALMAPFAELDPVRGLTFSNAPFSDEAWNLHAARSIAHFGHLPTDEWQAWLLAAPFTALQAVAFAVFGPDLVVARLVVIAAVAVTGGLITLALASAVGRRNAWLAGLAYVTTGLVLYYGRLAFLEPLVGALLAAGVLTLVPAIRGRPAAWGALAGVAMALAVMTKAHAIAGVIGIVAAGGCAALSMPWARRWFTAVVVSGGAVAVAWVALLLLPRADDVVMVVRDIYPPYQWPRSIGTLVRNVLAYPFGDDLLALSWPVVALALVGVARVGVLARRGRWRPGHVVPTAAAAGFVAGIGLLSIPDYNANRYAVAFMPLAAIAGAWALPRGRLVRSWRWPATAAATLLIGGQGIVMQLGWLRDGGSEVAAIQAIARQHIRPGSVVVGQYASLVVLDLPVQAIVPFGETINDGDWYARGARYFTSPGDPEPATWQPVSWEEREQLGCFVWGRHAAEVCLYELPD